MVLRKDNEGKGIKMDLNDLKCICDNVNLDEYLEFRELVKENMNNPEWLGDLTKEDLNYMLNNGSKIWIYYLKNELICSMMIIPIEEEMITLCNLNIDKEKVIDYGPMMVNPKYVGYGLQYKMLQKLNDYCIKKGYRYVLGTIHPDNIYSIRNLEKDNFKMIVRKEFKRGLRNIYYKELINKVLVFIKKDDKYLLLKGSDKDPQFKESFWYTVSGHIEDVDMTTEDAVIREVKEETNLNIYNIKSLNLVFKYNSLNEECIEEVFLVETDEDNIILNEENIDYEWLNINEFIDLIKWYSSKEELKDILLDNNLYKDIKIIKI